MIILDWHVITPSNSPKYMVKGTELNQALCGLHRRYALIEVRIYDVDHNADISWIIRDAETLTDEEVKEGQKPRIVAATADYSKVEKFLANQQKLIDAFNKKMLDEA